MIRLLLGGWLLLGTAWADVLPHPDVIEINAEVDTVFAKVEAAQAVWITSVDGIAEGRYVQMIAPASISDGTTATKPDLKVTPSHRVVGAAELDFRPTDRLRGTYTVGEYFTPPGRAATRIGFIMRCNILIAGEVWQRTKHVGPEDRRIPEGVDEWLNLTVQIANDP